MFGFYVYKTRRGLVDYAANPSSKRNKIMNEISSKTGFLFALLAGVASGSETSTTTAAAAAVPANHALTLSSLGWVKSDAPSLLSDMRFFYDGRLRGEMAEIDGFDDATLLSLRSRLGVETGAWNGWKMLAEVEHTQPIGNAHNYQPFPGGAAGGNAMIGDPDNLQMNRLQLGLTMPTWSATIGRQGIKWGDERFVGTVGWRQNDQTFDAVSVQWKGLPGVVVDYAFIDRVNRIFGVDAPQESMEHWDSSSHLIRVSRDTGAMGVVSAFAYLLDFDNAPGSSYDTFGMEWQGRTAVGNGAYTWLATAASQCDAGDNPNDLQTEYFRLVGGYERSGWTYQLGAEWLGSDDGHGAFQFPIATNHKFQGYADAFATTPKNGLLDIYGGVAVTCPLGIQHGLSCHYFESAEDQQALGWEVDYTAAKTLNEHVKVLAKIASLKGENAQPDVLRASIETQVTF